MLLTDRPRYSSRFEITEWVEFDRNGRASCPSCLEIGKTHQKNLSLIRGSGAYKCHRGCTNYDIRSALGAPPPRQYFETPRRKPIRRSSPSPLPSTGGRREFTVSGSKRSYAHRRLLDGNDPAAADARRWLEERGITSDDIRRHRIGLSDVKYTPDKGRPEITERYPAISLFIPHPTEIRQFYEKKRPVPWLTGDARPEGMKKWSQYGVPATLWILHQPEGSSVTWIAEGEWDAIQLVKLVEAANLPIAVATGTAGAGNPPSAENLARIPTRDVVLWFDWDEAGQKGAVKWADALEAVGKRVKVGFVPIPEGCPVEGHDITDAVLHGCTIHDFIKENSTVDIEAFRRKLIATQQQSGEVQDRDEVAEGASSGRTRRRRPTPNEAADAIASERRDTWAYTTTQHAWRTYGTPDDQQSPRPYWRTADVEDIYKGIEDTLRALEIPSDSPSYTEQIERALRRRLTLETWDTSDRGRYIGFRNGVLDVETKELLPHDPKYRISSLRPYDYNPIALSGDSLVALHLHCPETFEFFRRAMNGDPQKMLKLLAIVNATIRHRWSEWHMFEHIIGDPRTGKSTFARLLTEIVGPEGTKHSFLGKLHKGSEIAHIIDASLVVFSDETCAVDPGVILKMTGGDPVRYRDLYSKPAAGVFTGLALIVNTKRLAWKGNARGIEARQDVTEFFNPIPKEQRNSKAEKAYMQEIPLLISVALGLDDADVEAWIKGVGKHQTQDATRHAWELRMESDSLAHFINQYLIVDPEGEIPVGNGEFREDGRHRNTAFGLYRELALAGGFKETYNIATFSPSLIALLQDCAGITVTKERKRFGMVLKGVRLRGTEADGEIPFMNEWLAVLGSNDCVQGSEGTCVGGRVGLEPLQEEGCVGCVGFPLNLIEKDDENSRLAKIEKEEVIVESCTKDTLHPTPLPPDETLEPPPDKGVQERVGSSESAVEPAREITTNPTRDNIYIDAPENDASSAPSDPPRHSFEPGDEVHAIDCLLRGVDFFKPSTIVAISGDVASVINYVGQRVDGVPLSRLQPWTQ